MANIYSINSVGDSIIQYLRNAYPEELRDSHPCSFRVISSGEMEEDADDFDTSVTLYLYRIIMNEHVRNSPVSNSSENSKIPLSVDLHFMMTVWSNSASSEHIITAWAMRQLHHHAIMDVSSLTEEGGWLPSDVVHIIPAELSNEDLMRIWDAVAPNYRLSLSYIARVIRIDPDDSEDNLPVVSTRFQYQADEAVSNE